MKPDHKYFLKTDRLGFRHWTSDDLPLALAVWGDAEVTRFVGGPFSSEQVAARLQREITSMSSHGVQYWPIFLLNTWEHVGVAGMRYRELKDPPYSVGYYLLPKYWGKGFATEAGRAVITFAFEELNAKSLFAGHHPENAASGKVLEKLGFHFTHKELYPPTDLMHHSYLLERPTKKKTGHKQFEESPGK